MTIRRDVAEFMCSYPIETVRGGRHEGVRVAEGYYLNYRSSAHKALNQKQTALLRRLRSQLTDADLDTIKRGLLA